VTATTQRSASAVARDVLPPAAGAPASKRTGWLLAAVLMLAAPQLIAESVSVQMKVSVQVVARAIATIAGQPHEVVVTADDIVRGSVDLEAPVVVQGRTNSRRGYLLHVTNTSGHFPSMQLVFDEASMNVSGESWIARPYTPGGETVSVRARVRLAPGTVPGRYPLALAVTASPL
jgi:hypothetical protein